MESQPGSRVGRPTCRSSRSSSSGKRPLDRPDPGIDDCMDAQLPPSEQDGETALRRGRDLLTAGDRDAAEQFFAGIHGGR